MAASRTTKREAGILPPRPRPRFTLPQVCEVKPRGAASTLLGILRADAKLGADKNSPESNIGHCKTYM